MNGISTYQENVVTTQSGGRLIVLMYDGAVKFLNQAIVDLQAGKYMEKGQNINKAADILQELDRSLNMEVGGEMAMNLHKLCFFMIRHLHRANFQRDPQMIRDVIKLLEDLNVAWKAVAS